MNPPRLSIIMRSYNEAWALEETLPALQAQSFKDWELIVIDSGSTDGSVGMIQQAQPAHFIQIQSSEYNPSKVLNHGMRLARTPYGIFLNADATPQGPDWLAPLFEALQDEQVAAVFGRQIPRPDCEAVFACDYERCFGHQRESAHWDHFFPWSAVVCEKTFGRNKVSMKTSLMRKMMPTRAGVWLRDTRLFIAKHPWPCIRTITPWNSP